MSSVCAEYRKLWRICLKIGSSNCRNEVFFRHCFMILQIYISGNQSKKDIKIYQSYISLWFSLDIISVKRRRHARTC